MCFQPEMFVDINLAISNTLLFIMIHFLRILADVHTGEKQVSRLAHKINSYKSCIESYMCVRVCVCVTHRPIVG